MEPKKRHKENVRSLKDALKSYNINPFNEGPAKAFTTGVELISKVIKGLLKALTSCYDKFLIEQTKSIYAPIKRQVEKAVRLEEAFFISDNIFTVKYSTLRQGLSIFKIRNPSDGCSMDIRWHGTFYNSKIHMRMVQLCSKDSFSTSSWI